LLLIGLVSIGVGVVQLNPALLAFGCILFTAPLVAYVLLLRSSRKIDCTRVAPVSAFEGDTVHVELTLANGSDQSLFFPQIAEVFTPEIHAQKHISFSGRLAPDEVGVQSYTGHCILPRGKYQLGPTTIRLTDPLGWFEVKREVDVEQSLKIYPSVYRLPIDEQLGRCLSWVHREQTTRGVGESNEFHTVREYRAGDSRRRIHWGLTARLGYPIVREFARTAVGDLTIVLDAGEDALVGWGRSSSTEYTVKIALAIATDTLDRGHRVRFLYASTDGRIDFETTDRSDFQRALDAMVEFRTASMELGFLDLIESTDTSSGTVVIMLHPYVFGEPRLEEQLRAWIAKGVRVLAILFEALHGQDLRRDESGSFPGSDVAMRHARRLEGLGARARVITCGDPMDAIFPGAARVASDRFR